MPSRPQLGQHFLADQGALERIAEAATADGAELVVEVGPGRGALTRHLLRRAPAVVAIEYDPRLARELRAACDDASNLHVVQSDVLACDLVQLVQSHANGRAVIAGNLPYYITSPILRAAFYAREVFSRCVFLIQKEVADRVTAREGSRDFGYLSCVAQLNAEVRMLFTVRPGAFNPPPKVMSAVIQADIKSEPPPEDLLKFLEYCFRAPRKTLRNNLSQAFPRQLVDQDLLAGKRAQQVSLVDLTAMWERLAAGQSASSTESKS